MNNNKVIYITICNYDTAVDSYIKISNEPDEYILTSNKYLKVKCSDISSTKAFYDCVVNVWTDKRNVSKFLYFDNGRLAIRVPFRVELCIDSFVWDMVYCSEVVDIKIQCDNFGFSNSIFKNDAKIIIGSADNNFEANCKQNIFERNTEFEIYGKGITIDFSKSHYKNSSLFKINPIQRELIGRANFSQCTFGTNNQNGATIFNGAKFGKFANFSHTTFYNNAYFDNAVFIYADFRSSKFNQTACFYQATFKKPPTFNKTIFKENLNLVNSNLNFNFDECKEIVKEKWEQYPHKVLFLDIKVKDKLANGFRDSFRICKNALIKDNNLLDASNYHKIELYFKEIELDSKKPKNFSKEWIDLWQLKLYRLTSNHHTDLLRIFSCIVILIGCFATTLFFAKYYGNPNIWYGIFWAIFGLVSIFTAFGKIRYLGFFTLLSLVPCAWLVSYNPKYIFGVASLFGNNNCNGVFLNFAFSIYTILFILLIFSLQKTARKNSIIPT